MAWGLEQSKYFTQGCNDLLVVTDHKPLVKILGDRTLDEISNTRIFRLKQRTLPWSFDIAHLPGKTNSAADATSRHPSPANEFAKLRSLSLHSEMDDAESAMAASLRHETHDIIAISWERIATETASDPTMRLLLDTIQEGFPDDRRATNDDIAAFCTYRDSLNVTDGVILYRDRIVVPPSLRDKVLRILHSGHQGVSSMESRARSIVFWPGMTNDIRAVREHCSACNRSAPSQAATPGIPSPVPSTPFESIFADFFDFGGCHYLMAGDRLSGWVEIFKAPHGTAQAGAQGLSLISSYCRLSNQMGSPSSHVLCVFPPVKRSCRSGGQKGKAHANGHCWPHWVSEQRWPPACITPGAQHAGPRLQYIASTGGIWQAHSRCFFLHQPMHQVQQPIDTSHMA